MTMRTHCTSRSHSARQAGAALLAAMLTVTLVATFAAGALWQQWRATEVEAAERARVQAAWVLIGALDWSRLILREDGRATSGTDNLSEPWAVPLEEARLTSFLAGDKNVSADELDGLPDAFLSGRIVDAQSKLNVMNLVENGKLIPEAAASFTKLFELLGLPTQEVAVMASALRRARPAPADPATGGVGATTPTDDSTAPLIPQQLAQIVWLGVSPSTAAALEPYATVLPIKTTLNVNTASAEALFAAVPELDLAGARRVVLQRAGGYFKSPADAFPVTGTKHLDTKALGVATGFFEVHGRLRLENHWVDEHSLVQRNGTDLTILWRERGAGATVTPGKL
ncbi:type II secretion system minor pseudopilin GspK [Variovorax arabinosiphilus]|uniref:type II secretion system minor pseudopilin GspK n=1 Tax=Variovorax arabinosiphilus TaxID=3053498 RepID=UPI0025753D52|nr:MULTISPECIES: type II secretion system minor pseudopilin GspK [unclassified Variovorax]MDM0122553.1 type II secretion system minor pseudopilin GspK [Variovorax sp. J2L1-78]MDM0130918.1 type II secretion system minor pseudopilin GspK [Variovorax sp. J2L1-63]MDM0235316.1 type II secretion system minor pseudopilin GspK [Variovorax sp. J2R1-6]